MGMFDSFYAADGTEHQTKALACNLDRYTIGDRISSSGDYQIETLAGIIAPSVTYATVRGGVLAAVGAERDPGLLLIGYFGEPVLEEEHD